MNHPAQWKQLTADHFGRQREKRSDQLMLDLLSVDCGLKSALLLDFSVSSTASLQSFLGALKQSVLLKKDLLVVSVGSDMLIVNPAAFEAGGNSCERIFSSVTFVDVSTNLNSPQLIANGSECLEATKTCFTTFLERRNSDGLGTVDLPIDAANKSPANPSTLFGMFLGYPVVYFYDMLLESGGNCLSMVPLVNFVVKGRLGESSVSQVREHTVMSFSVPEIFLDEVGSKVEAWFGVMKERRAWRDVFIDLTLKRLRVQFPAVCL
ncbi:UPF0739 protein C1orf74 homolog [Littorina saxatilis]|uniref:Uncharacterized protein n=1 Tax=Littorina saxatilis TaxID=31220 RepID=A0AAN9B7U6_9CAEN